MIPHSFPGFPWADVPSDSVIVDVGGNIGAQTLVIAKAFPHLSFVVQDLPGPIRHGIEACDNLKK